VAHLIQDEAKPQTPRSFLTFGAVIGLLEEPYQTLLHEITAIFS